MLGKLTEKVQIYNFEGTNLAEKNLFQSANKLRPSVYVMVTFYAALVKLLDDHLLKAQEHKNIEFALSALRSLEKSQVKKWGAWPDFSPQATRGRPVRTHNVLLRS